MGFFPHPPQNGGGYGDPCCNMKAMDVGTSEYRVAIALNYNDFRTTNILCKIFVELFL